MPDRVLTRAGARENVGNDDGRGRPHGCRSEIWTPAHVSRSRRAAQDPEVVRIFVNPAIKKALCRDAGSDRAWLNKVRPIGDTTIISTSASAVPPDSTDARRSRPLSAGDRAAARNRSTGSPTRSCIPAPHRLRQRRSPRCGWLICRPPAGRYCSRRRASFLSVVIVREGGRSRWRATGQNCSAMYQSFVRRLLMPACAGMTARDTKLEL